MTRIRVTFAFVNFFFHCVKRFAGCALPHLFCAVVNIICVLPLFEKAKPNVFATILFLMAHKANLKMFCIKLK